MSTSVPSPSCPRCYAPLRAQAVFCANCGLPLSPPSAPGYEFVPAASQGPPGSWAQSQPGYQQYSQPGYPGFPAAPVAAPPKPRNTRLILLIVALVVLLGGGGAASWFLYFSPSHSNSPFFDRHGLPDSVPLPDGLINFTPIKDFHYHAQNSRVNAKRWAWGVDQTTPDQIEQFYLDHLPDKGWTHLKTMTPQEGFKSVYACQGGTLLTIGTEGKNLSFLDEQDNVSSTVMAPSGGSVLGISLITGDLSLVDPDCSSAA